MRRAKSVDDYLAHASHWKDELIKLREVLRATPLNEEVKWGAPCYTWKGKNVVGIGGFKSYFGLWFHQGALLKDEKNLLINAQEEKTRALRQWRMNSPKDIKPSIIKRYVKEAISLLDQGVEIRANRSTAIDIPIELRRAMRRTKGATAAFRDLRRGLQREYTDYIASAKRDETRQNRIAKILPMIIMGVGLNDKYRGSIIASQGGTQFCDLLAFGVPSLRIDLSQIGTTTASARQMNACYPYKSDS